MVVRVRQPRRPEKRMADPRRRGRIAWRGVVLVGVLAWCSPAGADMWHYVGDWLDFTWNVSATETYDDNIFNTPDGKEDDFITMVGLDSRLVLRHPLGSFTLFYRFDQAIYLGHSELNDLGQAAGLGQNQSLSLGDAVHLSPRDTLSYSNAFSRTPDSLYTTGDQRAVQQPPVDAEGLVVGHQGAIRNTTQLGYDHAFRVPLSLGLNGAYTILEYDDPLRVDSRDATLGGSLSWRLSALRSVGLAYSHTAIDFDSFPSSDSEVVSLLYNDEPLPTWKVNARVGASFNSTADSGVNDVTPDMDVRVAKELPRGSASAGYRRHVSTSRGYGGVAEQQAVNLAGSYRHTPVWSSRLSATYSDGRSEAIATQDTDRFTVRYDTGYPLGRLLTLTGGYLYSNQRQSDETADDRVTNNRIFIGLRYGATLL